MSRSSFAISTWVSTRSSLHGDDTRDPGELLPGRRAELHPRVRRGNVRQRVEQLPCEGPVAGPHLRDLERVGSSEGFPEVADRTTEQLPEHGMDVGTRDEVAVGPYRRAGVEPAGPVQGALHELGDRDRAVVTDGVVDRPAGSFGHAPSMGRGHDDATPRLRRRGDPTESAWEDGDVSDAPIRRAASVICVREGGGGPEVLVVERSLESRFLPGYVAFPGGAVEDADAEHAERWFGSAGEAPRAAAIRELLEEVGLVLNADGLGATEGADPLARVHAAPPTTRQLPEMAHWIAPPAVPVRFDARYFAVSGEGCRDAGSRRRGGVRRLVDLASPAAGRVGACGAEALLADVRYRPTSRGVRVGRRRPLAPVRDT